MLGRRKFYTLILTAVLGLAMASTASAGIVASGSIAFSMSVASYTWSGPQNLQNATSITLSSTTGIITSETGIFLCGVSPCTPNLSLATFLVNPFAAPPASGPIFLDFDSTNLNRYQFTVTGSLPPDRSSSNALVLYLQGTFQDAGGTYNNGSASVILDFTQTGGPNNAISGSGTFQTPSGFVPEPATMAMLGSALIALRLRTGTRHDGDARLGAHRPGDPWPQALHSLVFNVNLRIGRGACALRPFGFYPPALHPLLISPPFCRPSTCAGSGIFRVPKYPLVEFPKR